MMKSFFKKLAFVMALAMVVTTAAPAANVFAATALKVAHQTTGAVHETYELAVGDTVDFKFYGAPTNWAQLGFAWTSSNEEVATVTNPAGVVKGIADGVATITIASADGAYVGEVVVTVGEGEKEEVVATIEPKQLTANSVKVTFTEDHNFDATGADADGVNTVKVYRVFSSEEMAKMPNKNGLKFDEAGNGYQAYYIQDTNINYFEDGTKNAKEWTIVGYNVFTDGATYAVVYGENETSSTINGIMATFTAYVGKVAKIVITATQATVENDVEPAIPAYLTTKLYNVQNIDLTDYYKNADETDYELVSEDIEVSVSGNEVTFDETGAAVVLGSYTFYDEDKEEDVTLTDEVVVLGGNYSTYRVESIYNWTLKSGYKNKWAATSTSMIAGDEDQLYVIVKDNRGNYFSNVPGIEATGYKINNVKVLEIGNGDDNTPFEQYGYKLVFDSLDPDSLLVDADGAVETYKKTNSFAVVSYQRADDESAKLYEIGVMGIEVKAARKLDSVKYNATSFTVLKETEAEDGDDDFYNEPAYANDFKLSATLKVSLLNQYGKAWDEKAEDWDEAEPYFTVTTSKDDFVNIAEDIADALNDNGKYVINPVIFEGTNTTSVTFKIKERATGDSTTVTIKLEKPKYVTDANGVETDEVFVDPTKAVMSTDGAELYYQDTTTAKLYQVSKASQKVGYFRIGAAEMADEKHGYYVANALTSAFVVKKNETEASFVTTATGSALAATDLKAGDYILVVTDPSGKVFPTVGNGGNGKSFGTDSQLGIVPTADGTAYELVLAAEKTTGEMEYAPNGTYRATVYKITNIVKSTTTGDTKYSTSRVSSDSFVVTKSLSSASFFHQEETKDVAVTVFNDATIVEAIAATMTFRINGENFNLEADGTGAYKSNTKLLQDDDSWDYEYLPIEIADVDYKVQNDGKRAVVNTVTFKIYTPVGGFYYNKVKVNRSVNLAE